MFYDVYFDIEYGRLYEKVENGIAILWRYEGKEGILRHLFIKREIPIYNKENKKFFDIVTPYGYGGPIVEYINPEYNENDLINIFEKEFSKYCIENNIVAEFIRFHPLINNVAGLDKIYSISRIRNTLANVLDDRDNIFQREFSKSARKKIRQCLRKNMTYSAEVNPDNLDIFKTIYRETMNRNNASEYYYFDDEYFDSILKKFGDKILLINILFDNKVIDSSICFISGKYLYVHLSGTLNAYLEEGSAYLFRHALIEWSLNNGIEIIHHGGGKSNSDDDSLYLFKRRFASTELSFFVGKKIWDKDRYDELCEISNTEKNIDFFPAYRSNL